MDCFTYKGDCLHAEEVALTEIAASYGTPCYVYSRKALTSNFAAYSQALAGLPHLVCYAVKANSNLAVIDVLAREGAGFDIVSGGELERVIAAGGDPSKVIFSGLGKTPAEIERALDLGIRCFNVESESELERINEVALSLAKVASISLRVNPDVDAQTHPYISTGLKENKFGIASERAIAVYQRAAQLPGLKVTGIDCHIGSQLTSLAPFIDAVDRVVAMIDELAELGIAIEHFDMGGGLGVTYADEQPPTVSELIDAVKDRFTSRGLELLMEPGRSISANAGIFVTKVEYLKRSEHKNFAIVDGAMNDLLRPALYGAWQEIVPVVKKRADAAVNLYEYDIVGPVCESSDFLGKDRSLALSEGDLLAIRSSGAYSFAMSSNYNTRNRAPEIIVDGKQVHLVRQRETLEDQLRLENCLPKD